MRRPSRPSKGAASAAQRAISREVERAALALGLRGARVLVAVSGGIDSCALLDALCGLRERLDLSVAVGHVDHGLRGEASRADAAFVEWRARELGCDVRVACVAPREARSGPSRTRPTLQEAARTLRYEALRGLASELGASRVATAHTSDDQAETLLLRLLRGCGPDALGGIPERSEDGIVVRPLLRVSRARITAYAGERRLEWREDASNESRDYARNRIRLDLIPALVADFNPQLLRAFGNLAEGARRDAEWIRSLVDDLAQQRFERTTAEDDGAPCLLIDSKGWSPGELPEPLAERLVARALAEVGIGREVARVHISRALDWLRRPAERTVGRWIELPCGVRLARTSRGFVLRLAAGAATSGASLRRAM